MPIVVSGSMDTSIGLTAGLFLAANIEDLYGACGFGTGNLLADDLCETVLPVQGKIKVQTIEPDLEKLELAQSRVDENLREFLLKRLTDCYEMMEAL
jgi:O-succinylbenzoate synthase